MSNQTDTIPGGGEEEEDPFGTCFIHVTIEDDDCDICKSEMEKRIAALQTTLNDNDQRLKKLNAEGFGIDIPSLLGLRLDTFIKMVVPSERMRHIFETTFHAQITEIITEMERKSRNAKLTAGVNNIDLRKFRK